MASWRTGYPHQPGYFATAVTAQADAVRGQVRAAARAVNTGTTRGANARRLMTTKQLAAFLRGCTAPHTVRVRALVRHGEDQTLSLHQTFAAHGFGWLAALTGPRVEVHLGMLAAERVAIPRCGKRTQDARPRRVSDDVGPALYHAAHDTPTVRNRYGILGGRTVVTQHEPFCGGKRRRRPAAAVSRVRRGASGRRLRGGGSCGIGRPAAAIRDAVRLHPADCQPAQSTRA